MKPVSEGGVYRLILCQFENRVLMKPVLEGAYTGSFCVSLKIEFL